MHFNLKQQNNLNIENYIIMENKIVLVTGGAKGIGRSICIELAERNYTVIFTYLSNEEKAKELVTEITTKGKKAFCYACDMSNLKATMNLATRIKKEHGILDALVNNAGILGDGRHFLMSKDDNWWNVISTNLGSVTNTCRVFVPQMVSKRAGRIINITSLAGQRGSGGQSAYSSSKAAIVAFSKSLLKEVGSFGLVVNCVSPGLIETDMTNSPNLNSVTTRVPLNRMGNTQEVASLVSYLVCDAPLYFSSQEITIDGGLGHS
jgi:NAD(P)-dependent dehydrogenase (short-subunit alcohol dehydrogenase family)